MPGEGPFLWLSTSGPPSGFWTLPKNGMCISAFVFLERDGKILLGKYAEDPRWETLAGLDPERARIHGRGWTVPASQLKFGEEPRAAGRRVLEEILGVRGVALSEPRVESDQYRPKRFPELGDHYDIWFLSGAKMGADARIETPPWYRELAFVDPDALAPEDFGRGHEDVVARWRTPR